MTDGESVEIDGVRFTARAAEGIVEVRRSGVSVDVPMSALAQFVDLARTPAMLRHIKRTIWGEEG